jgi:Ca-activated chloride channel homolog
MDTFRFANPGMLYMLLLLPALVVLLILTLRRRKAARERFGNADMVKRLLQGYSNRRAIVKFLFCMVALTAAILTAARPQFGSRLQEVKREGVEVIIALDVSNSMLAEDIAPSRLERAKQAIAQLVDQLRNDKIGLILFAGDAYTQIPVTNDYLSAKMFLESASTDAVSKQGTNIGSAIELGMRSFSPQNNKSKALIIITDGENHEDDAVSKAKEAAEKGVVVYTIGIGSPDGTPIPVTINGKTDYLKDTDGNTVLSKLDESTLKEIASVTSGRYVKANNTSLGLNEIYNDIGRMKKSETSSVMYTDYNDQFMIPALIMLVFLLIEFFIMDRKNNAFRNLKFLNMKF